MDIQNSLDLTTTGLKEIRLLINSGRHHQALEVAEALKNVTPEASTPAKEMDIRKSLDRYFKKYPHRKDLSHWSEVFARCPLTSGIHA